MNRIARTAANLIVATGLATAALTFSGTAAHAETPPAPKPGPVLGLGPVDPGTPDGPGDIKTPDPKPQPPKGPQDLGVPKSEPKPPKGPKDLADSPQEPVVDPKPADPVDPAEPKDGQDGGDTKAPAGHHGTSTTPTAPVITTDAPTLPADRLVAAQGDPAAEVPAVVDTASTHAASDGHELAWLIAAGAGAGLGGLVLVAARRRKQAEEA